MDNREKLKERIRQSLNNANNTLGLKYKIESDIANIMQMVNELTDGVISHEITDNANQKKAFSDSDKIVFLRKISNGIPYGFIIFGFSLNSTDAYPVLIETETEIFNCSDEDSLKDTIAHIIDRRSLKIMELVSQQEPEIPF